jgi:mRNA interferase MazF
MSWQRGDVVLCAMSVGIRVDSIVRCESIFTLNQSMVLRRLGKLSVETIVGKASQNGNRLNGCLIAALSL